MSDLIVSEIVVNISYGKFVSLKFKTNIRHFYFNFGANYYPGDCTQYQQNFINECLKKIRENKRQELISSYSEDANPINYDIIKIIVNNIPTFCSEVQSVVFYDLSSDYPTIDISEKD